MNGPSAGHPVPVPPGPVGVFAYWPNRITAIRFLGALALFALLAWPPLADPEPARTPMAIAFWLFVVIAATDVLDGWLARRGNQVTAFGRIADPFVDKVLVVGSLVFLTVMPWSRDFLPAWVVVAVVAREFLVTGIRGYVESVGGQFPADRWGKLKMIVQCVAVGALLGRYAFPWGPQWVGPVEMLAHVAVWTTLVTTVGSGITYVAKARQILTPRP